MHCVVELTRDDAEDLSQVNEFAVSPRISNLQSLSSLQIRKWQIRHELQVMKYSEKMSRRRCCLRR